MIQPVKNHQISFQKSVPTIKVVEMITACDLDKINGYKTWEDSYNVVTKAMTNKKIQPSAELARQCCDALTEKYETIKQVILNYGEFIKGMRTPSGIDKWKTKQVELIGSETLEVPKIKPDRIKMIQEKISDINPEEEISVIDLGEYQLEICKLDKK